MQNFKLGHDKLRDIIKSLGVVISYETANELICYCPFHDNNDSPAFNMNKRSYLWRCWNGKCAANGNLIQLFEKKGYTRYEAEKMLINNLQTVDEFVETIEELLKPPAESRSEWLDSDWQLFRQQDQDNDFVARNYLRQRDVSIQAYDYFRIGYASKKRMLTIPVFNEHEKMCGIIGRSIDHKQYQYSAGLDRSSIIWNLQNARKECNEIILTEGAFDSIALWDSGLFNCGAVLGSAISVNQWRLLRKYFSAITLFFDNDDAGNSLRDSIIKNCKDLSVSCVLYPDRMVQAKDGERPVKDPGELTREEIISMYDQRRTSLEMQFML